MPHGHLATKEARKAWSWVFLVPTAEAGFVVVAVFFVLLQLIVKEKPYPVLWNGSASSLQGLTVYSIVVISQPGREKVEEEGKKIPFKDVMPELH